MICFDSIAFIKNICLTMEELVMCDMYFYFATSTHIAQQENKKRKTFKTVISQPVTDKQKTHFINTYLTF